MILIMTNDMTKESSTRTNGPIILHEEEVSSARTIVYSDEKFYIKTKQGRGNEGEWVEEEGEPGWSCKYCSRDLKSALCCSTLRLYRLRSISSRVAERGRSICKLSLRERYRKNSNIHGDNGSIHTNNLHMRIISELRFDFTRSSASEVEGMGHAQDSCWVQAER